MWLVVCSLFFYGWWDARFVLLIGFSLVVNFFVGRLLTVRKPQSRWIVGSGITVNLLLLGYFKYTNFFVDNVNALAGTSFFIEKIVLPIGISFFTFQQIAYLVDAHRGEAREYSFLNYCLFVCFFPQLIAGPIVHHKDILPQFEKGRIFANIPENLSVGLTIFIIGLFKKVVIADGTAMFATPIFEGARQGAEIGFYAAWGGAIASTLQIYFDFSAYSDMAIGLGRMFGIRLPVNFNSPYKATSIIEYWSRWHMTLSNFLRNYVYFPLGGGRHGEVRKHVNIFLTMLIAGLWHGAGWTFVIWGGMHGALIVINHCWRHLRTTIGWREGETRFHRAYWRALLFLFLVFARVFYTGESVDVAFRVLGSMTSFSGGLEVHLASVTASARQILWLVIPLAIAWFAPNTQEIMARFTPALVSRKREENVVEGWWQWRPTGTWAVATCLLLVVALVHLSRVSPFIYFQF